MMQKILSESQNIDSRKNTKTILSLIEEREMIETKINTVKENLAVELLSVFKNHSKCRVFEINMLKTKVMKADNKESEVQFSLLKAICLQIAESINGYYKYSNDHSKALINHGARFYDISHEALMEAIGSNGVLFAENLSVFNEFLKDFDVIIKIHDRSRETGFRISIEIFPEF